MLYHSEFPFPSQQQEQNLLGSVASMHFVGGSQHLVLKTRKESVPSYTDADGLQERNQFSRANGY